MIPSLYFAACFAAPPAPAERYGVYVVERNTMSYVGFTIDTPKGPLPVPTPQSGAIRVSEPV